MANTSRNESRRILAERLRRFVSSLMRRFTVSSDELLRRAEAKHAEGSQPESAQQTARPENAR
jgi:hypothetical protein